MTEKVSEAMFSTVDRNMGRYLQYCDLKSRIKKYALGVTLWKRVCGRGQEDDPQMSVGGTWCGLLRTVRQLFNVNLLDEEILESHEFQVTQHSAVCAAFAREHERVPRLPPPGPSSPSCPRRRSAYLSAILYWSIASWYSLTATRKSPRMRCKTQSL